MNKGNSIFIFANAYAAETAMYMLDYVLDINYSNIILLKENHSSIEFENRMFEKHIVTYDDIDECLENSDYILVIKDVFIPQSSIDKIVKKSKIGNKKYIVVDNPWEYTDSLNKDLCDICEKKMDEYDFGNVPNILLIGCGMASQLYCTEVLINNILTSERILFSQIYSDETRVFLEDLSQYGINQAFISPNIIINIGDDLNNIKNYLEIINKIQPDFIILQVPEGFMEFDLIVNFFKYGLMRPVDIIIKSRFIPYKKYKVLCRDTNPNNTFKSYDDIRIKEILKQSIFSKMSLPICVQKY